MTTPRNATVPFVPADLIRSAQTLAQRAAVTVFVYAALGFLIGLAVGAVLTQLRGGTGGFAFFLGLIGAALGFAAGQSRAFEVRLRAQTLMCLASIEDSVRRIY